MASEAEGLTVSAPLEIMQECIDEQFPGSSLIFSEFDNTMLEFSDLNIGMEGNMKMTLSKFDIVPRPRKSLKPKLRTSAAPARDPSARAALSSLIKRNFGVDFVASPLGAEEFGRKALEKMMDVYCVDDWREKVLQFDPIRPTEENLKRWMGAQATSTVSSLQKVDWEQARAAIDDSVDVYEFILKNMPKTSTDDKVLTSIPAVQTIMFHPKYINAFFGPLTREADRRFKSLLRDSVLINKAKNLDEIEAFLGRNYLAELGCLNVENDFSNYDRSQAELALMLDILFLKLMGLDEEYTDLWLRGHVQTTGISYRLGIVVYLWMQRKSGDVLTSDGNTRYNMCSLAYCLDLKSSEIICSMFLGDDSFFQFVDSQSLRKRVLDCSKKLGVIFNATAKTAFFDIGYFCGYYILPLYGRVKMASDPWRRAIKLGRWDVKSFQELKEHWVSFGDALRGYESQEIQEALAQAVTSRMPKSSHVNTQALISALYTLKKSYKEFVRFWESDVSVTCY